MEIWPRVTFGFVNCNRLFYLQSCVESLLACTTYPDIELIIVDNASLEPGTDEYLNELSDRGYKVHKTTRRDPSNEYARALNYIVEHATGEYICPLAGDMQFIVKGDWLQAYVKLYEQFKAHVGCIAFDAQRSVTHASHKLSQPFEIAGYQFVEDASRFPIAPSANVMFSRENLDVMGQWAVGLTAHEGGGDSENAMRDHVTRLHQQGTIRWHNVQPVIPPAAAIYTDPRGTNARIRDNRRYGEYWPPKESNYYYSLLDEDDIKSTLAAQPVEKQGLPLSIERMAQPIGFSAPIDSNGNWLKNPIRPESAEPHEWVSLGYDYLEPAKDYVDDWLDA